MIWKYRVVSQRHHGVQYLPPTSVIELWEYTHFLGGGHRSFRLNNITNLAIL